MFKELHSHMMKICVSLSEMRLSKKNNDVLFTSDLGSDMGISIFDPVAKLGGVFHGMLPEAKVYPDMAKKNPFIFVDTGLPLMLEEAYSQGAFKGRLIAYVAGGADLIEKGAGFFSIGKQNIKITFEILSAYKVNVSRQAVGGNQMRSLYLTIADGKSWINQQRQGNEPC
jgi:chemotaxis protein CheD